MSAYKKVLAFHAWVHEFKAHETYSNEQEARTAYRAYKDSIVHARQNTGVAEQYTLIEKPNTSGDYASTNRYQARSTPD